MIGKFLRLMAAHHNVGEDHVQAMFTQIPHKIVQPRFFHLDRRVRLKRQDRFQKRVRERPRRPI